MKRIILLLFLLPLLSWQSDDKQEPIEWNADRKLTWADYKGQPDSKSYFKALTNYGLTTQSNYSGKEIRFTISVFFYPNSSWVDTASKTGLLLKHEQLHFDIAELYGRKFRKKAAETVFNLKTVSQQLKAISSENQQNLYRTQEQYDRETKHSIIETKQAEWQTKIENQLKELDAFSNPIVKAALKK